MWLLKTTAKQHREHHAANVTTWAASTSRGRPAREIATQGVSKSLLLPPFPLHQSHCPLSLLLFSLCSESLELMCLSGEASVAGDWPSLRCHRRETECSLLGCGSAQPGPVRLHTRYDAQVLEDELLRCCRKVNFIFDEKGTAAIQEVTP